MRTKKRNKRKHIELSSSVSVAFDKQLLNKWGDIQEEPGGVMNKDDSKQQAGLFLSMKNAADPCELPDVAANQCGSKVSCDSRYCKPGEGLFSYWSVVLENKLESCLLIGPSCCSRGVV